MNGHSQVTCTHERAANDLRNCLENYETFSGRSHTSARAGLASLTAHLLTQHVTPIIAVNWVSLVTLDSKRDV